jgi:hypothetical protein
MIARLKLKSTIDATDAKETMEFYNVILQQLDQIVNVATDPSDETFECCISVLRTSPFAILFEDVIKSACAKNDRVRHYIGEKFKLRENKKLRSILERLRNHSHIRIVNEKPVALQWVSDDDIYTSQGHLVDSSNTVLTTTCAPCDQCDPTYSQTEKNSEVSVPDGKSRAEGSTKKDPESIGSHRAHRSQLTDNNPTDNSSVPWLEGTDEVIDDKNDDGQITEEIQSTGNVIETESGPTNGLEEPPPSPQFECYYCKQCFPSNIERIAHMDKESADAREKRQLDG